MRNRLFASLIVCVALLTQLGASFWGATAARDGYPACHKQVAAIAAVDGETSGGERAPAGAPASHDHATCSLCQLGFTAVDNKAPVLPVRSIAIKWRIVLRLAEAPPLRSIFNISAPARAPPSQA